MKDNNKFRPEDIKEHNQFMIDGQMVPYPMDFDVYFEQWKDPYDVDVMDLGSLLKEEPEEYKDFLDEVEGIESTADRESFEKPVKMIMTPYGMLPLSEQTLVSKHFKFWVGHTNFNLEERHLEVIEGVLGVEALDFMSPLRFRIAVGKMFRDNDVNSRVREALINDIKKQEQTF